MIMSGTQYWRPRARKLASVQPCLLGYPQIDLPELKRRKDEIGRSPVIRRKARVYLGYCHRVGRQSITAPDQVANGVSDS